MTEAWKTHLDNRVDIIRISSQTSCKYIPKIGLSSDFRMKFSLRTLNFFLSKTLFLTMKMFHAGREGIANIFILEYDPWQKISMGIMVRLKKQQEIRDFVFGVILW